MDFFKNKIRKFQEKKLDEILFKIQFHESTRKKLEKEKGKSNLNDEKAQKKIKYHREMEKIWKGNEEKLRKQMKESE